MIRDVDCGTTIVPATARQRRSGAVGDSSAIGEVGDGATPYIPNPPVPRSRGRKVRKRKRAFYKPNARTLGSRGNCVTCDADHVKLQFLWNGEDRERLLFDVLRVFCGWSVLVGGVG